MAKRRIEGEIVAVDKTGPGSESAAKNLGKVGDAAEKSNKQTVESASRAQSALKNMANTVITVRGAFDAVRAVIGKVRDAVSEYVVAADTQQAAEDALTQALARRGQATADTIDMLKAQASAIQGATTAGDEYILQQQAALISMGATTDKLDDMSRIALDVGAALQKGPTFGFEAMRKVAQGNFAALAEVSKRAAETGVATGDLAQVLGVLREQFGGAAELEIRTFSGAMTQLTNSMGDSKEITGAAITQNAELVAAINAVRAEIDRMNSSVGDGTSMLSDMISRGVAGALLGFRSLVKIGGAVVQTFNGIQLVFRMATAGMLTLANEFVEGSSIVVDAFAGLTAAVTRGKVQIENPLKGISGMAAAFSSMATGARADVVDMGDAFQETAARTDALVDGVSRVLSAVRNAKPAAKALANEVQSVGAAASKSTGQLTELAIVAESFEEMVARRFTPTLERMGVVVNQIGEFSALTGGVIAEEFARAIFNTQDVLQGFAVSVIDAISQVVAFNREAALSFAEDQEFAARSSELSFQRSVDSRLAAETAFNEARRSGDEAALRSARLNLDAAVLAEQQAAKARTNANQAAADAKINAEEKVGSKVLKIVGGVLVDIIKQTLQAAAVQVIAALITGQAEAIAAHAGIPVAGVVLGGLAAAGIAALIGGLQSKLPKAAQGGIVGGSSFAGDKQLVGVNSGEVILNVPQQIEVFGAPLQAQGTTPGGLGGIPQGALSGARGAVYNFTININGAGKSGEQLAREMVPTLRRLMAQGA